MISRRAEPVRFVNLNSMDTDQTERILAHEIHHACSDSLIYKATDAELPWAVRTRKNLVGQMVSKGVAMQCNPRIDLEREIREDSVVIRFWIDAMNRTFAGLKHGRISESQFQAWSDGGYERARGLLLEFLKRHYPDKNTDSLMAQNMPYRPELSHTLGWWMVSKICDNGASREKVIRLLSSPDSLASWYNAANGTEDKRLLADEGVW